MSVTVSVTAITARRAAPYKRPRLHRRSVCGSRRPYVSRRQSRHRAVPPIRGRAVPAETHTHARTHARTRTHAHAHSHARARARAHTGGLLRLLRRAGAFVDLVVALLLPLRRRGPGPPRAGRRLGHVQGAAGGGGRRREPRPARAEPEPVAVAGAARGAAREPAGYAGACVRACVRALRKCVRVYASSLAARCRREIRGGRGRGGRRHKIGMSRNGQRHTFYRWLNKASVCI